MKTLAFCVAFGTLALAAPTLVRADAVPDKPVAKKETKAKKDATKKGDLKKDPAAKKDEPKKDDKPAGGGW